MVVSGVSKFSYLDNDEQITNIFQELDDNHTIDPAVPDAPTVAPIETALVVDADTKCTELENKGYKIITVKAGFCKTKTELNIEDYHHLTELKIEEGALEGLTSLKIQKNFKLAKVTIGNKALPKAAITIES